MGRRESFDGSASAPKKARKSASTSKLSAGLMSDNVGLDLNPSHDLELFESSEDMLFEPDSFEELKAHAQRGQSNGNAAESIGAGGSDFGDEAEDFSALLSANHTATGTSGDNTINNLDAWK
jgi:hypothetical protein